MSPVLLPSMVPPPATRLVSAVVASRVLASSSRNRTSTLRGWPEGPEDDDVAALFQVFSVLFQALAVQGNVLPAIGLGAHYSRPASAFRASAEFGAQLNLVICQIRGHQLVRWARGLQHVKAFLRRSVNSPCRCGAGNEGPDTPLAASCNN